MALTDHVGILVAGSFDKPQINKLKKDAPPQYYAVVAYDPAVAADLSAAMAEVAPGGNWQAMQHGIKKNSALPKPYAGIADDAIIVRFSTQFAVEIYDQDSKLVAPSAENSTHIRSQLFAGQRVRINGGPYAWNFQGKPGVSWNLFGVMAVGGGERRAATGGSFDKYLQQPAEGQDNAFNAPAQTPTESKPATGSTEANPFQQAASGPADPFG